MLTERFIETALAIRRAAPANVWEALCSSLKASPASETKPQLLLKLPASVNSDLGFLLSSLLDEEQTGLTWREIGLCLESMGAADGRVANQGSSEVIWSGPATEAIPARRIDQVLYDLTNAARQHILLVTFAAAKISFLSANLAEAIRRGVCVELVLEFETESAGQLTVDAKAAFPEAITRTAHVYYWPLNQRTRNQAGRPGKLHAKCAVVDDNAIVSSANLTDDAFNRNMELGVLFRGGAVPNQLLEHFHSLIASGILNRTF